MIQSSERRMQPILSKISLTCATVFGVTEALTTSLLFRLFPPLLLLLIRLNIIVKIDLLKVLAKFSAAPVVNAAMASISCFSPSSSSSTEPPSTKPIV